MTPHFLSFIMQTDGCESEENWVPSDDALILHWRRCCYVMQIWKQTDVTEMDYPDITDWGWTFCANELIIRWD